MLKSSTIALAASTLIILSGCNDSSNSSQSQATPSTESSGPAWILTSAPAGDVSVTEAKASASEGDQVVIRGRIGGRRSPINAESPIFTIVDLDLEYCGQFSDDSCGTPWDYCCDTPTTITEHTATVQVQGDGVDLVGAGFEPLDEVVLIGVIGARPNENVFTVNATGIYPVSD